MRCALSATLVLLLVGMFAPRVCAQGLSEPEKNFEELWKASMHPWCSACSERSRWTSARWLDIPHGRSGLRAAVEYLGRAVRPWRLTLDLSGRDRNDHLGA